MTKAQYPLGLALMGALPKTDWDRRRCFELIRDFRELYSPNDLWFASVFALADCLMVVLRDPWTLWVLS